MHEHADFLRPLPLDVPVSNDPTPAKAAHSQEQGSPDKTCYFCPYLTWNCMGIDLAEVGLKFEQSN